MPDDSSLLRCHSPVDGRVYVERELATAAVARAAVTDAARAGRDWRKLPIGDRVAVVAAAVSAFVAEREPIAAEISWQMGRPIGQAPGEVAGFEERARHMLAIAPEALADIALEPKPGFTRFIRREALGTVFVMAPWNYPYLTAVNALIPALLAGNAVILKHSSQTPLCAERLTEAFAAAGLPNGVFRHLHLGHDTALGLLADEGIDFVAFTGSVAAGHSVQRAVSERFVATGLELGGKDPAYVRPDADLEAAAATLVDGAFFNSGQSCCGIERIYVHAEVHDRFVDLAVALVEAYRLGSPLEADTNLGPMVRAGAADFVREQVREAVAGGARALIDPARFAADAPGTPYLAPQVLVDVDHGMRVMTEESFGPVVGIQQVGSDEEAIERMNDSRYGLTAAVFTSDDAAALSLGDRIETGTWFQNRCDFLDPGLAWTGVKDSGRGCTLSRLGYEALTRPKSFHLKSSGG